MTVGKMPEFDPPPIIPDRMETLEGRREWVQELCQGLAMADLRQELEQRRQERLSKESRLVRFALRVFSPVLADPLDVIFGPKPRGES